MIKKAKRLKDYSKMNSKISKNTKYLIIGALGTGALAASVVTPIIILNNKIDQAKKENESVKKEDETISKIAKILKNKSVKEKTIILSSDASGKIVANNQDKIIPKVKTLIGEANLKETKMEILMAADLPISTTLQNIFVSISKKDESNIKTISIFQVKREFSSAELSNKDIEFIKTVLDSKVGNDLIITLPSDSTGNIISNVANKNPILKKLRELIDPSNTNGEANHQSLKGTTVSISMRVDRQISTTTQNIIVSISKADGTTLNTTKIFRVKRDFTANEISANEDIVAIKKILDAKTDNHLIITLPSDSTGNINDKNNKNAIEKELRKLIDLSNNDGAIDHASLRGTKIEVSMRTNSLISTTPQNIVVSISKANGKTLRTSKTFQVRKEFTNAQKIENYFANEDNRHLIIFKGDPFKTNPLNTQPKILAAIKKHLASKDPDLWTNELQDLITTHRSEVETETKWGVTEINYSIAYTDDLGNTQRKINLDILHLVPPVPPIKWPLK